MKSRVQANKKEYPLLKSLNALYSILLAGLIVVLIFTVWFSSVRISDGGMAPVFQEGDVILFDKLAKHAGAGTLVPITGFANSVVSPAIDSHAEGLVLGVGAKIFTVAGPVILYGLFSGVVYGVIYYLVKLIEGLL